MIGLGIARLLQPAGTRLFGLFAGQLLDTPETLRVQYST